MKRWIFGSVAFFVTLLVGIAVAWPTLIEWGSLEPIPEPPTPQEFTSNTGIVQTDSANVQDSSELLEVFDDDINDPSKFNCQLLETGSAFHADQIKTKNGEKWLGLFNDSGKYSLRSTTVKVKRVADELLHGPTSDQRGKLTGKSISVGGKVAPLFLVKNSHRLRQGLITTLFEGQREDWKDESVRPTYLDKNFSQSYELAGKVYDLKVSKAKNIRGEPILALLLEGDGKRQLLHTFWTRSEGDYGEKNWLGSVGTLYWVGDLDRDNRPDFYLSLYAHETIYAAYLLLSSEADNGKLVKKVAVFSTSGCG